MSTRDGKSQTNDERLARRAKALFDDSVEDLNAEALSRLNRGRQAALQAAQSSAGFKPMSPWVPAAGIAAAAVFAAVLWRGQPLTERPLPNAASDIEILLNDESFEMLNDLEFYSWVDQEIGPESESVGGSNVG
jgi:hypothetical protein